MLNSQQQQDEQLKLKLQSDVNEELRQRGDEILGRQPLVRVEGGSVGSPPSDADQQEDDRGRILLPDGALESSV